MLTDNTKKYVLALDQGTTSSRAILFDQAGWERSSAQQEFPQYYPQSGWVEHDPEEIWQSQLATARKAIAAAGASAEDIAAIGITNQRETTLLWDRATGQPVMNAIVWQCRRTAPIADRIAASPLGEYVKGVTGLLPDAYFSATKLVWMFEHIPGLLERAKRGELACGTVDSWLIWKLTGGRVHATDYTNASRTMLFDIRKLCWDEHILAELNIPKEILPEVRPSASLFGMTDPEIFGAAIPIAAAAGDQHAALFGQRCTKPGDVKNTYGTGCFLMMHTGSLPIFSGSGLVTTIAASADGQPCYALEGSVFVGGAAIQWLRDELGIIQTAAESEALARSVPDTAGAYLVPAFTGLGAPHWDQYARGVLVGLTRGCGRAHIVRAALESIAYQTLEVLRAMEQDTGRRIDALRVDGGASANSFLMQFQADILNAQVIRPAYVETTALGAAYLAGLASGFWKDEASLPVSGGITRFDPNMSGEQRAALERGWRRAVERSLGWIET